MKKVYKENYLGKSALLWALSCAFDLNRGFGCDFKGYENESDRVQFKFDGHKCKLLSVDKVDYENFTITATVLAKGKELKEWEDIRLTFKAHHFRYETLKKIVEEFYMCSNACANESWGNDVDAFISDKVGGWFFQYDYDMGYLDRHKGKIGKKIWNGK